MHIDFAALGLVAVVTLVSAVVLVSVVSIGARLLEAGPSGAVSTSRRMGGWSMFALAGLAVLFGLYLVIPYFHGG
ncbi:hypothetical protein BRM3_11615 [Brachybacterium huguangmaarense]|uniref:Uncharacterized protein n=1 Tax=Brachybacterium huguangmaarense TaxID=1652028 RepID=A0ABY6FZ70_9MICO|nr:hypothetical protein [Brachybacterium huguangmaarense]UYG16252.1 hypothetical protein BRM3_11615 [Brachybacterium huguangmaarense]